MKASKTSGRSKSRVSESQVLRWVRSSSPDVKRRVLKELIPNMDRFEDLVDYGGQKARKLCAARNLDWDKLDERERERGCLIDRLLHEGKSLAMRQKED